MAALSSVWQETTRRTSSCNLERSDVTTHNNVATRNVEVLRRCSLCCCGVTRVVAALHAATLRRCGTARCDVGALWRCSSGYCGTIDRVAAALGHYSSRCYGVARGRDVAALRVALLFLFFFFFFFWMTLGKFKSVRPLFMYVRKREKHRARKNKRELWNLF